MVNPQSGEVLRLFARSFLGSRCDFSAVERVVARMPLDDRQSSVAVEALEIFRRFAWSYFEEVEAIAHESEVKAMYQKALPGYVYMFHLFDDVYKIGYSKKPDERARVYKKHYKDYMAECESNCMGAKNAVIDIVHVIETVDMKSCEIFFHNEFEEKRIGQKYIHQIWGSSDLTAELFELSLSDVERFRSFARWEPEWWQDAIGLLQG